MTNTISRREFMKASAATGAALMAAGAPLVSAQDLKPIELPQAETKASGALIELLRKRSSSRAFSPEPLPPEVLSTLLWAAFGVNRPDGRRTAPTANDKQEIDVYVATAKGLYAYEAKPNRLNPILATDIRALTGVPMQPFVKTAPVNLIYVADYSKMTDYYFGPVTDSVKDLYVAAATGCISQNVYLYCAAEGLATVLRAEIDKPALASVMKLRPDQKIVLAQSVGYPPKRV
jgi:nitroreductase